jgi:integrase
MAHRATKVWIRKRKTKQGVSYSLRWRDEDGAMRSKLIGRVGRECAEQERIKKEHSLTFGGDEEVREIGWDEFVEEHLQFSKAKKAVSTADIEERVLQQIGEFAGPEKLSDLTYARIERFFTHRIVEDEVSPATVNKQIRTLRSILARAVKLNYLKENPAAKMELWKVPERELRVLEPEEVEKLLEASPTLAWRTFIYLAASCGLRSGELCNLKWKNIDLDRGLLSVKNRSHWQTKSRKNRLLGLTERAMEMLKQLGPGGDEDNVFVRANGGHWGNNIQREFNDIVKQAGIERCTPHDLRRTFCTEMSKKVSAAVLKDLAGHSDLKVTEKYYLARAKEEQVQQAALALPY